MYNIHVYICMYICAHGEGTLRQICSVQGAQYVQYVQNVQHVQYAINYLIPSEQVMIGHRVGHQSGLHKIRG